MSDLVLLPISRNIVGGRPIPVMVAGNLTTSDLATGKLATDLITSPQKAELPRHIFGNLAKGG